MKKFDEYTKNFPRTIHSKIYQPAENAAKMRSFHGKFNLRRTLERYRITSPESEQQQKTLCVDLSHLQSFIECRKVGDDSFWWF